MNTTEQKIIESFNIALPNPEIVELRLAYWRGHVPKFIQDTDPALLTAKYQRLLANWNPSTGAGLVGPTGCGKTRSMGLLMVKHLLSQPLTGEGIRYLAQNPNADAHSVRWAQERIVGDERHRLDGRPTAIFISHSDFASQASTTARSGDFEEWISDFEDCEFLGLDDIGKATRGDRATGALFRVVDHRYANGMKIAFTTQFKSEDLAKLIGGDYGPALVRRLKEMTQTPKE
ncbi:MAG: hypothetical protein SFY80_00785 [Verrucomicrobiota bacterium]|nr:hypothetical protein [Verrucomicrobiota bacterium]